jgi:hypothetical protein
MERLMPSLVENLRDTNRRLSFSLDGMLGQQGQPVIASPENLAALLSELLRAGAGLRAEPISEKRNNPELDKELEQYRCNVERLRDLLPSIHCHLLAERGRLEVQRGRVRTAAQWARASRQTL